MTADLPMVSCLCPTYGRFELLRLSLACFLAQDYPARVLIVLNDAPEPIDGSRLEDHVIVINRSEPFPNLGAKRQALLERAETPLVAHWDDDDLYLPHHLSRAVAALRARGAGCVKSKGAYFMLGVPGGLKNRGVHHNVFEATMLFLRDEGLALGGYPGLHSGQAKSLMGEFGKRGRLYPIPDEEGCGPSCIVRWANGIGHTSACGTPASFRAGNTDFGKGQSLTPGDPAPFWAAVRGPEDQT